MQTADQQHLAWIARSFGRPDYLPLTAEDLRLLTDVSEVVSKYPGTHLFKEDQEANAVFLIEAGEVDIYRTASGKKRVVSRVGPGQCSGTSRCSAAVRIYLPPKLSGESERSNSTETAFCPSCRVTLRCA